MMVLASIAPMNLTDSHCGQILFKVKFKLIYRISANRFRGNYSFLKVEVRKVFEGGNYSREETINLLLI